MNALLERLTEIASLGLASLTVISSVHPATRRVLADWGYRYDVWGLRRFASPKRNAIVLCFLQAARAETTDAVIEMQDKLITGVHNKARLRYDDLLRATEEARSRAVEVLEELGMIVLDESIPDSELRGEIFARLPSDAIGRLVDGCRNLWAGNEDYHLGLIDHWYGYTRKYSPALIEKTPFQLAENSPIGPRLPISRTSTAITIENSTQTPRYTFFRLASQDLGRRTCSRADRERLAALRMADAGRQQAALQKAAEAVDAAGPRFFRLIGTSRGQINRAIRWISAKKSE